MSVNQSSGSVAWDKLIAKYDAPYSVYCEKLRKNVICYSQMCETCEGEQAKRKN